MNSSWGRDLWAKRPAEEWSPLSGEFTMASDEKRRSARSSERNTRKPQPPGAADRPFDRWLQKQLHAMYDEIAGEPLPTDLVNLIEIDKDAAQATERKDAASRPAGKQK